MPRMKWLPRPRNNLSFEIYLSCETKFIFKIFFVVCKHRKSCQATESSSHDFDLAWINEVQVWSLIET
jgi:hypothetical protein